MMWGFLNIVQIIYFMPLLSHFYPAHFKQFLSYLSSAKLEMDFFNIKEKLGMDSIQPEVDMPALNEDYEDLGYESTSILVNSEELFTTISMGIFT